MDFNLAKLIEVLAENAPNEAVGIFIGTYGMFIAICILLTILLIRFIIKTSNNKSATDKEVAILKESINKIMQQATEVTLNNNKVTDEIKAEIKANNDVQMQFLIALGISSGMNYTDITNIINKATAVYNVSVEQYKALEDEAVKKVEEQQQVQAQAQAEAQAQQEKLQSDLASIKIGV